jgi:cell division protein FtsL
MTTPIVLAAGLLTTLSVIFLFAKRKLKINQLNNKIYRLEIKIFDYDTEILKLKKKIAVLEQNQLAMSEAD